MKAEEIDYRTADAAALRAHLSVLIRLAQGDTDSASAPYLAMVQRFAATLDYTMQERRLIIHVEDRVVSNVYTDGASGKLLVKIVDTTPDGSYNDEETVYIETDGSRDKCERKDVLMVHSRESIDRLWDAPEWIAPVKHIENNGDNCPCCGGDQVVGHSIDRDGSTMTQDMSCNDCEATWTDEFQLRDYTETNVGG